MGRPHPGAPGRLRVSLRELDEELSSDIQSVPSFANPKKLSKDEIVPVDIEIWPHGRIWHKGEQLRIEVMGHYERIDWFEPFDYHYNNQGTVFLNAVFWTQIHIADPGIIRYHKKECNRGVLHSDRRIEMYIGHKVIAELLECYQTKTVMQGTPCCLTGYELLASAVTPYSEHLLYVLERPEELNQLDPAPDMNLFIFNPQETDLSSFVSKFKVPVNYTEIMTSKVLEVRKKLRDYFDICNWRGYLADSILDHLFEEKGIQDMVDDFADSFNNPIFVFDTGYRLVAATWEMALLNEHSRRMTEQMRVTDEDWKIINEFTPSDSEIKASHEPLLVYHPEYGHRQLVASIDSHGIKGDSCL